MKKYYLQMNGENYLINVNGKNGKYGFIQNIIVEASSPKEAEIQAMNLILNDSELKSITLNLKTDPPHVKALAIDEEGSIGGMDQDDSGRAFYPEED